MKKIAILGSTGSIGTQTLQVVASYPEAFKVTALSAGRNIGLLEQQIRRYHPNVASVQTEEDAGRLKKRLADYEPYRSGELEIYSGMEGLLKVAGCPDSEMLVTAIVGMIGIRPTIEAIRAGKDIALANKETLVTAGHLIMPMVKEKGVHIYPVDSEHSAIAQCLNGEEGRSLESILLTASGGPFFGKDRRYLTGVRAVDALKHPNWEMGRKITVDSATLVNKGLEVIEASWLFGVPEDKITVIVQRQSIIHSMVQFADGGVMAQLGIPDMKLPIQYALFEGHRRFLDQERIDFKSLRYISFDEPDEQIFRGIALARAALREGGLMPAVMNAANEKAVALFLEDRIGFFTIYDLIRRCMEEIPNVADPGIDEIFEAEKKVDELFGRWLP